MWEKTVPEVLSTGQAHRPRAVLVYQGHSFFPYRPSGNEQIIQIVGKESCIKEHIVFELLYVSCIYLTS